MSRKLLLLAMLVALVAAPLAFAACGDDDDDEGEEAAAGPTEVTLTADDAGGDYTFELSETPTAETKTIVYDNQGSEPHALIYARLGEGYTVDEAYELEGRKGSATSMIENAGARPGQSRSFPVEGEVEPGNYVMLCPIGGTGPQSHWKQGQLEEFTIE